MNINLLLTRTNFYLIYISSIVWHCSLWTYKIFVLVLEPPKRPCIPWNTSFLHFGFNSTNSSLEQWTILGVSERLMKVVCSNQSRIERAQPLPAQFGAEYGCLKGRNSTHSDS